MDLETNAAGKHEILVSGSQRKPLVARTWSGRTRREHADEYLNYNYEAAHGAGRRPMHLERDPDYLLELPDAVEVSELHANDWQLGMGARRR